MIAEMMTPHSGINLTWLGYNLVKHIAQKRKKIANSTSNQA